MGAGVENIGKKDVIWSYVATIFMVGSGFFLLPLSYIKCLLKL